MVLSTSPSPQGWWLRYDESMTVRWLLFALPCCLLGAGACSAGAADPKLPGADGGAGQGGQTTTDGGDDLYAPLGGDRPVVPVVPESYRPGTPVPLVIMLHGYSASSSVQEMLFQFRPLAEEKGFIYLMPDGTQEDSPAKKRFWNATDACCNFYGSTVDDVAYLSVLIDEASARYTIDPKRVYFVGHSNGGFMSLRMACDRASKIAAVVSLAGAMSPDAARCQPSEPVSVLALHGTADPTIKYEGDAAYTGAEATVQQWLTHDGCAATAPATSLADYVMPSGQETTRSVYTEGCRDGSTVELWTMQDINHIPPLNDDGRRAMIDFLLSHPKP